MMEKRFIPGVYLYCDYWCERCRFADRCEVNSRLEEREEEHLARGEDPDSLKVIEEDLLEYLAFLKRAQQAAPEESGAVISAAALGAEAEKAAAKADHPLVRTAIRARYGMYVVLKDLRPRLHQERARLQALPGGPPEEDEIRLMRLEEVFEIIAWYHLQLVPRISRALESQARGAALGAHHPHAAYFRDSARGNAKLVCEILERLQQCCDEIAAQLPELVAAMGHMN
ncbi:MAG: hypothetical protein QHJ73_12685, partial [Armatimonadota bacterium]|nr:hypothetical protein [Armatimonadota bacterium]